MCSLDFVEENGRAVVIIASVLIILAPIILFQKIGLAGVRVVSVIISGLLTLALVSLYFHQSAILRQQTEMMSRDYQSVLSWKGVVADDDMVKVKVRNTGRGKIRRLYLKSEIVSDTADWELGAGRVPMKDVHDASLEIPPESNTKDFTGRVIFPILNEEEADEDRALPFQNISRMLSTEGVESVRLLLTLEVLDEDYAGEPPSNPVEIVDQELSLKSLEDDSEREIAPGTTVEEGIESVYSTEQDINKTRIEDLNLSQEDSS